MELESLPIDMSNPAVQDYLSLVRYTLPIFCPFILDISFLVHRLQVLTPLSLLINIATVLVCASVVSPSIGHVFRMYQTSISFNPYVIGIYVIAIYLGQIGYCFLLVLARKPETKVLFIPSFL
jgi:hypothetical protein